MQCMKTPLLRNLRRLQTAFAVIWNLILEVAGDIVGVMYSPENYSGSPMTASVMMDFPEPFGPAKIMSAGTAFSSVSLVMHFKRFTFRA